MRSQAAIEHQANKKNGSHAKVVKALHVTTPRPSAPPAGYRLVEEPMHRIGIRDLVFVGGVHSGWRPARRAGEAGSLRRESAAVAVAALLS